MKLTLEMLLYFISSLNPEIVCRSRIPSLYVGVKAFFKDVEHTAQCIYVSSLKEVLQNQDVLTEEMTVLAVRDEELPQEELESFPCTLILVDQEQNVLFLVNLLVDIFSRLQEWDKTMHISVLEGKDVQDLVDLSQELLQYPVIVFDVTFNVLAYSQNTIGRYEDFDHTVQNGYTNTELMTRINANKIFENLEKGSPLVKTGVREKDQYDIFLNFYSGEVLLGYACVIPGKKEPEQGYLDLLKLFAENISFCLKRDYESSRYGKMMHETFLLNLMNPSSISREKLIEQAHNMDNFSLEGRFALWVIEFTKIQKAPMPFIARHINQEMSDIRPFIYDNRICLLKSFEQEGKPDEAITPQEINKIDDLLNNYEFYMGVSNIFYDITNIYYAYIQARAATSFQRKDEQYSRYKDIMYRHMFSYVEKEMPVSSLYPEFYLRIKEYDRDKGTNYLHIIMTYLECNCNATHAGEKLYLHRNSVRKAVQFVEDRWGIEVSDVNVRNGFFLSEMIDSYISE